jgi:dihydrodipicolinate synthase/N-acetylneuraminate lyase
VTADGTQGSDPRSSASGSPGAAVVAPPLRPRRRVTGMSAVLLPFDADGDIDWGALAAGIERTAAAGLVPAVNMDTGYGPALDEATRARVLAVTAGALAGGEPVPGWTFVAGAHVDGPHAPAAPAFDVDAHRAALSGVAAAGGVPIVFPSAGLAALPEGEVAPAHAAMAPAVDRLLGFELGTAFHPHGRIWSLETYAAVLEVRQVVGAKHSSLRRGPEWARLAQRDARRPGFLVLTGNDLAIDLVRWGSDYLLGLSAFAPDAFARRDALWAAGDDRAYELDDALQALGALAFRTPVPAYRHDAALAWRRGGWAATDRVHPGSPVRPPGEDALVATLLDRLDDAVAAAAPMAPAPVVR